MPMYDEYARNKYVKHVSFNSLIRRTIQIRRAKRH